MSASVREMSARNPRGLQTDPGTGTGTTQHAPFLVTPPHFNRGRFLELPQREQGGTTWEREVFADGPRRLREFLAAPQAVQDDFVRRLAKQAEAERDFDRYADELHDDDPTPPRTPDTKLPRERLAWDETWSKRARLARRPRRKGGRDFEAERDALYAIEARTYVTALTGVDASNGKVRCPLPDHDERTGSLQVYPADGGWYCFGCHRGGGIYDFAAALWGLTTRGRDFREIHDRLCELMGVRR